MSIEIEVTWPIIKTVPIPDSGPFAADIRGLNLRPDLVRTVGNNIVISQMFGSNCVVQDVNRYAIDNAECPQRLQIKSHNIAAFQPFVATYPYVDRVPTPSSTEQFALVILLESPHRDEFGASVGSPIGPARGVTGEGIDRYLETVLRDDERCRCLIRRRRPDRVIITNPIPFQTSLYAIHRGRLDKWRTLRDKIWRELWKLEDSNGCCVFQRCLLTKLQRYNPALIINACTGGEKGLGLKVTKVLSQHYPDLCIKKNHPSSWK